MPTFAKLFGFFMLTRKASASRSLVERMLAGMAAVFGLTLISTLLIAALLIGGMFFAYDVLIESGWATSSAYIIVGGVVMVLTLSLVLVTVRCVNNLRTLPEQLLYVQAPLAHRASSLADAFMDGILTSETRV